MVVLQEGIILFLSVYAGNWQQWDARSPVLSPALWDGQNVTLAVVAAKETSFLTLAWQDHGDLWPLLQIFWLPLLESIWFCYSFHLTFLLPKIPSEDFAPYIKHWQIFKQTNSVMCVCVSAATVRVWNVLQGLCVWKPGPQGGKIGKLWNCQEMEPTQRVLRSLVARPWRRLQDCETPALPPPQFLDIMKWGAFCASRASQ